MNNKLCTEYLEHHTSIEDINRFLSKKNLSQDDRRYIQIHKLIAEAINEIPKENLPHSSINRLYLLEQQSPLKVFESMTHILKQFLLYTVIFVTVIFLLNFNIFNSQVPITNSVFLSAGFGILFYQLLKSKFFVV